MEMGFKLILAVLSMSAVASAKMVNINVTSRWKPDHGWEIKCTWELYANDSLQSVRFSDAERQFMIYRPKTNGPVHQRLFQPPGKRLQVECHEATAQCVMILELQQPSSEDMYYSCEVSGERPRFRMASEDIQIIAIVPPSNATIEVAQRDPSGSRVVLNCTSTGLPAPYLVWKIGDQTVPQDFSGKAWNATSMLWKTWSLLTHSSDEPVICKPETNKNGNIVGGISATYSAGSESSGTLNTITGLLSVVAVVRELLF